MPHPFAPRLKSGLYVVSWLLGAGAAWAACPNWPTATRFEINGDQVTDRRTGLVWARCSLGQSWSGNSCTGTASSLSQEEALRQAQGQVGWRLPNVKELASLADVGCANPAIDQKAFPATRSDWYWSSTPYVLDSSHAWAVHFSSGSVSTYILCLGCTRTNSYARVRLVRASP